MRRLFLAGIFLSGACGAPLTGVDSASIIDDGGATAAKKGGKRGGRDGKEPVICIEQANAGECPEIPIGPIVGL